ncbi:MAG: sugar phosphate isomerase/epimerase [Planctomycetes bacterium]|nr:sugar phosphate isomerase/epimerase [Planctomycetota bacterium]
MPKVTSISSLGWAHYTLYEALPRMYRRGFQRVELASFESYCFHFNTGSPTPAELRSMLQAMGLSPVCLNFSRGRFEAWRREEIDHFVEEWTRKLPHLREVGIPMISMPFGERNDRADQELQLANAVEAFDRVGEIAASMGIRTVIEVPHLYTIMPRTEPVLSVFQRLSSRNVGALVDSSHWGIIGYDADAFFDALGGRLWHVHLRDSKGPDTADRKQALELTPGKGTVDFRRFGQALDRAGYRGDVSIEFEYRDMTLEEIEREYDEGFRHLAAVGWEFPSSVRF